MCERLLNLQEIYVSGQNICIEVYGNSVGTITPPGTKGVPSISILVISRRYHQLTRYRENSAQTLFGQR